MGLWVLGMDFCFLDTSGSVARSRQTEEDNASRLTAKTPRISWLAHLSFSMFVFLKGYLL
jgi:hypothetical protein